MSDIKLLLQQQWDDKLDHSTRQACLCFCMWAFFVRWSALSECGVWSGRYRNQMESMFVQVCTCVCACECQSVWECLWESVWVRHTFINSVSTYDGSCVCLLIFCRCCCIHIHSYLFLDSTYIHFLVLLSPYLQHFLLLLSLYLHKLARVIISVSTPIFWCYNVCN